MISMKLKHWRIVGAAAALVAVSGCYAHGHVGFNGYGEGGYHDERGERGDACERGERDERESSD